jgi:hypothetical protein
MIARLNGYLLVVHISRFPQLASLTLAVLTASGCGGSDPTEPRPVRETKPAGTAPAGVPAKRETDAPTRGLACDVQSSAVKLCGAATDNYKASFNADPSAPERRSWLAIYELEVRGKRYKVAAGQKLVPPSVKLVSLRGAGNEVDVTSKVVSGPASVAMRVGPQVGLWGPLVTLDDNTAPPDSKIVIELTVAGSGKNAVTRVEYVRDPSLIAAPKDSLEYGGPGGRWRVDGFQTATNLELGWE